MNVKTSLILASKAKLLLNIYQSYQPSYSCTLACMSARKCLDNIRDSDFPTRPSGAVEEAVHIDQGHHTPSFL